MGVWQFIQDQVLGMAWLNDLIGRGLSVLGLDAGDRIGGSIQFFLYDVLKITILLCLLIFAISYIQSYFPPERSRRIGAFPRPWCKYHFCFAGHCNALLFLLIHSAVYRFHRSRTAIRRYLFVLNFIPNGRSGQSYSSDEYFRRKGRSPLCGGWTGDCGNRRHSD